MDSETPENEIDVSGWKTEAYKAHTLKKLARTIEHESLGPIPEEGEDECEVGECPVVSHANPHTINGGASTF